MTYPIPENEWIMRFWKAGFDTWFIAKKLGVHEAYIYNKIIHLRSGS